MSISPPRAAPDFRRLFESSPGCNLVLEPDLTIVAVSDTYLRATYTTRDGLLGRCLFDAFPDNPRAPDASGVQNLRSSLERVLTDRRPDVMPIQKYDIRRPESEGGAFEERYWSLVNSPLLADDGEVLCIIHCVEDVTQWVHVKQGSSAQDQAELAIVGEEHLRLILDASPDAMLVFDTDARIRFVNAQSELLFGFARAELLGRSLATLVPERFRASHTAHLRRYFGKRSCRTTGAALELLGLHKNGTEIPIEVNLSPLPIEGSDYVSAAIRDISDRKRSEARASLVAARLASAVESIQDAFALFDENDQLVLCNSEYRRLLSGVLPGALIGRHYEEILDAWLVDLDLGGELERAAFKEGRSVRHERNSEFNVRTRDGRTLRVMSRRTPEGGVVKTIWDLTDDARVAKELEDARAAAEAANAAKSEFLSSMSHELRTPLHAILGFSQLLERDAKQPLTDRHRARVEQIIKGGEHLLRLIDDILDLARIEAGGVSISVEPVDVLAVSVEPVDVLAVLEQVRTTVEPTAAEAGIRLELAVPAGEFPMIAADRTRFAQILMNFGSNAIKYNRPDGSVRFTLSAPSPECVRVAVVDSGMGIPEDKQASLFQPFERAGQETGSIEGTGIGLAITRRLAQAMGGSVGFRSSYGQGSEFWVDMPVHSAGARASVHAALHVT
jgi:PAS domain S-box-containing protein